jgi:hypothetical protein
MEAASTPETSINFYQTTRRNNPEDSHLHTCRRENLKSGEMALVFLKKQAIRSIFVLEIKRVPVFMDYVRLLVEDKPSYELQTYAQY